MDVSEWLRYTIGRDERDASKGICASDECDQVPVVVGYSDTPAESTEQISNVYACSKHAHALGWSGVALSLSEGEISLLCQMSGVPSSYDNDYESMQTGVDATIWTNHSEDYPEISPLRAYRVGLTAIVSARHLNLDEAKIKTQAKLFEGTILRSTDPLVEVGSNSTGIIFPDQFITIFPHDPTGDYANRAIAASMAYVGIPRP